MLIRLVSHSVLGIVPARSPRDRALNEATFAQSSARIAKTLDRRSKIEFHIVVFVCYVAVRAFKIRPLFISLEILFHLITRQNTQLNWCISIIFSWTFRILKRNFEFCITIWNIILIIHRSSHRISLDWGTCFENIQPISEILKNPFF